MKLLWPRSHPPRSSSPVQAESLAQTQAKHAAAEAQRELLRERVCVGNFERVQGSTEDVPCIVRKYMKDHESTKKSSQMLWRWILGFICHMFRAFLRFLLAHVVFHVSSEGGTQRISGGLVGLVTLQEFFQRTIGMKRMHHAND